MTVIRGETFTIDRTVVNRDGSPFIVSSEYENPYILISVASTKYNQQNRYLVNWWLSLDDLLSQDGSKGMMPRFPNTRVKEINSINNTSEYANDEPMEFVYHDKQTGEYKYLKEYNVGETALFEDYEFRIIHSFTHDITKDWVEQSYVYSIRLVAGTKSDNNSTRPIDTFDVVQDILLPSKLTVLSDLNGGLK